MSSGDERMTPTQAQRYLLSLELFGMRFGLDRMQRLTTALKKAMSSDAGLLNEAARFVSSKPSSKVQESRRRAWTLIENAMK